MDYTIDDTLLLQIEKLVLHQQAYEIAYTQAMI